MPHDNPLPTIAIFCKELKMGGDPFSEEKYWNAYKDLLFALKERGVGAYLASDNNTYRGFGVFDVVYTLDTLDGNVTDLRPIENVHIDLVFDRGRFIGRDVLMINPPILTKIAMSKIEMYEYFADFQPYSVVGNTKQQVEHAAEKIPGDKVVVKEPEGSGGNQVYIGEKEKVLAKLPDHYPLLLQEFLDTSQGIPGQVEGVHDARLGICGGEIISYFVRSAKEGRLLANVAQGGDSIYLDVKKVPPELAKVAKLIDGLFAEHPRYYSLDFMNTQKGWKLVELNSYLGLMQRSHGPKARYAGDKLADYLARECREESKRTRNLRR